MGQSQTDARSDIWSLGATLYQMVTGRSPKIIYLNNVPTSLRDILHKSLEDEKDQRYQSAIEFRDALRVNRVAVGVYDFNEGECPGCSTKNDPTRKFCKKCANSLLALCLSCSESIRVWEEVCDHCGTKQSSLIAKWKEEMSATQVEAEELLSNYGFDKALSLATQLKDQSDPRLRQFKPWAELFITKVEAERTKTYEYLSSLMSEASVFEKGFDYQAALEVLEPVHPKLRGLVIVGCNESVNKKVLHVQGQIRYLNERRSKMEKINIEVESLIKEFRFEEAIYLLKPFEIDNDERLADLKKRSETMIAKVDLHKKQAYHRVSSLMTEALTYEKVHDYESASGILENVPQKLRDLLIHENFASVNDIQRRIKKQIEYVTTKRNRIQSSLERAKHLLEGLQFEEAFNILKPITNENEVVLADLKIVSEGLIGIVEAERRETYQYISSVLCKAYEYEETHDLEACVNVLDYQYASYDTGLDLSWTSTFFLRDLRIQGYRESINEAFDRVGSLIREIGILNKSIQKLLSQGDLDRTVEEINKLLRLQPNCKDMIDLKSQLLERYHRLTTVRDESFDKAKRLFAEQNYEGCLDELDRIDESVTNLKTNELRKLADRHKRRLNTLYIEIKERVVSKQLDGLLVEVNELLSLKSDDTRILKLRDQLIERDSKNIEKEKQYREMRERIQAHELDGLLLKVDKFLAFQPEDMYGLKLHKQLLILKEAERLHLICRFDKSLQILDMIEPEFRSQFKDVIDKLTNEGSTYKRIRKEAYCSNSASLREINYAIDKGKSYLSLLKKVGVVDQVFEAEHNSLKKREESIINAIESVNGKDDSLEQSKFFKVLIGLIVVSIVISWIVFSSLSSRDSNTTVKGIAVKPEVIAKTKLDHETLPGNVSRLNESKENGENNIQQPKIQIKEVREQVGNEKNVNGKEFVNEKTKASPEPIQKAIVVSPSLSKPSLSPLQPLLAIKVIDGNLIVPLDIYLSDKKNFDLAKEWGIEVKFPGGIKIEPNIAIKSLFFFGHNSLSIKSVAANLLHIGVPKNLEYKDIEKTCFAITEPVFANGYAIQYFSPIALKLEVERDADFNREKAVKGILGDTDNIKQMRFNIDRTVFGDRLYDNITKSFFESVLDKYSLAYYSTESDFAICESPKKTIGMIADLIQRKHNSYRLIVESKNTEDVRSIDGGSILAFSKFSCYVPLLYMEKSRFEQSGIMFDRGSSSGETKILNAIKADFQMQIKRNDTDYVFSPYFLSNMFNRDVSKALNIFGLEYEAAKNSIVFGQQLLRYLSVEYSGDTELLSKVNDQLQSRKREIKRIDCYLSGSPPSFYGYYNLLKKAGVAIVKSPQDRTTTAKVLMYLYKQNPITKLDASDMPLGKIDVKTNSSESVK